MSLTSVTPSEMIIQDLCESICNTIVDFRIETCRSVISARVRFILVVQSSWSFTKLNGYIIRFLDRSAIDVQSETIIRVAAHCGDQVFTFYGNFICKIYLQDTSN